MLFESCSVKEKRVARFLCFPSVLGKFCPKPQPEVLKIGLRKDLLSGKTNREVELRFRDFSD